MAYPMRCPTVRHLAALMLSLLLCGCGLFSNEPTDTQHKPKHPEHPSANSHKIDEAIVYPPGESPYVLVVLTSGIADEKVADQAIAEISRAVWEGRKGPARHRKTKTPGVGMSFQASGSGL